MCPNDEDDKPTVVLDLNALKKQKLAEEEKLAHIEEEIEFDVLAHEQTEDTITTVQSVPAKEEIRVVLFDFQSDFFQKSMKHFPMGFDYVMATSLDELNSCLRSKGFQIVVFNYDVNAKAINQLSAQIKQKFPNSKVLIMAKAISPEKAKIHAKTPSGASGYYQLPLDPKKLESELLRIHEKEKKSA